VHAALLALAGGVGALALWAAAAGIAADAPALVRAAVQAGLWAFVGVTFVTAMHRMIPFLGGAALPLLDAWRPRWLLASLVAAVGLEGACAVADAALVPWAGALRPLRGALELGAGLGLLALALRWARVQNLRVRLIAMLHAAFVWLGLAFLLAGVAHAFAGSAAAALAPGASALHAYAMGFLGTTALTMVTRVTCGQSGRGMVADDFLWRLFLVLQVATALRVGGAVLAALDAEAAAPLIALAALAWAGVSLTWSTRQLRWFGQRAADGPQPGRPSRRGRVSTGQ